MSPEWQPPRSGMQHIHAVIRLDFPDGERVEFHRDVASSDDRDPITNYVTGTKAYETAEEADAEARRLNEVNGEKGVLYFVTLLRLVAEE